MKKTTIIVMGLSFLFACNNQQNTSKEHTMQHETITLADSTTSVQVVINDDQLNTVYQHYVHLTTALVNGDMNEAKRAANMIAAGAKDDTKMATIARYANDILNAGNIEAQRTAFASLSNEFISLVQKTGVQSGELYVDYCSMALNDKGAYWLSKQKEIKNPYFGEKMMTCGEVKSKIKK